MSPRSVKCAAGLLLALILNTAYLISFSSPTIPYMGNVLLHFVLGVALTAVGLWLIVKAILVRSIPVASFLFMLSAVFGLILAVRGNITGNRWILIAHVLMAGGTLAALLPFALRQSSFRRLYTVGLISLVVLFYVSVTIFVLGVLGGVMALAGLNIFKFLAYLREELTIVLATASSDAVLPQVMRKLERLGVKDSVVGLVIPTGYSFNLDAFSIYLTLAVVFIAQATNTPLSLGDLLLVLGVSLITSKGAHGVPGSAIVILAATLNAVPTIPAIGLVLVLSVDWFIGMARALGNLIGNCVATVVVAAWEGDLDRAKAAQVLDRTELVDVTAG